jgi:hypothetical protein
MDAENDERREIYFESSYLSEGSSSQGEYIDFAASACPLCLIAILW